MKESEPIGGPLVTGAVLLAISLLGAAFFLSQAVDRGSQVLGRLALSLGQGPIAAAGVPQADRRRPDPERRYPVTTKGAPLRGGRDAAVTIVEWSDFQCPFCGRVNSTLRRVEAAYGDRVRLVFKHLPLAMHPGAPAAHAAAEAAHRQGKFWPMHDKIFADPRAVDEASLARYAQEIGLDMDLFRRDTQSEAVRARIDADAEEARKLGVTGTPAFFVNGRFLSGAQPYESFKRLIDEELKGPG
jgi:protein-disulfide isomerase